LALPTIVLETHKESTPFGVHNAREID
jgi:hypothetical protein